MSGYIGGLLFDVVAKTDKFDAAMDKVSKTREKISAKERAMLVNRAKTESLISSAIEAREKAEKRVAEIGEAKTATQRKELNKLNREILNYNKSIIKLEKDLEKSTSKAEAEIKKLNSDLKNTQKIAKEADFEKYTSALNKVSIATAAIGAVSLKAWGEQERSLVSMEAALGTAGVDVDLYSEKFQNLASEIQKLTTYGDEVILANEQLALSMGIPAEKMEEFQKASVALSKSFGKSLPVASKIVARAMNGNFEMFNEIIPEIKNLTTEEEKLKVVNEAIARGWNIARKETETFYGSLIQCKNSVGGVTEEIGKQLAPAVQSAAQSIKEFADWFIKLPGWNKKAIVAVGGLTAALPLMTKAVTTLRNAWVLYTAAQSAATVATNTFKTALVKSGIGLAIVALGAAVGYAWEKLEKWTSSAEKSNKVQEKTQSEVKLTTLSVKRMEDELDNANKAIDDYNNTLSELNALQEEHLLKSYSEEKQLAILQTHYDGLKARIEALNIDLKKYTSSQEERAYKMQTLLSVTKELYSAEDKINSLRDKISQKTEAALKKELEGQTQKLSLLKKQRNELESRRNEILNRQASQAEYRKDFELQSKIEILKAQGKESEAKQLEFAQKRNELMERYGYSLEQANKLQKALAAAKNGAGKVEYSDEAKAKAKRILERGEDGSVGKRAIEDAQKIMSGEGGLKSTLFRDFEKESKNNSLLKNVNIDAKATRENLDAEAKKIEKENSNALKDIQGKIDTLNQVATDIKNAAQMISTQIKNTGTNSNG